jgi:hypothetical protein
MTFPKRRVVVDTTYPIIICNPLIIPQNGWGSIQILKKRFHNTFLLKGTKVQIDYL